MVTLQAAEVRAAPLPRRPGHVAEAPAWRPDIQGLRAVAVLLVVLSHAGVSRLGGGYVGVDVFFVISGFLITTLLMREVATTGGISVRRFYARRALRLLPASTLVALATLGGAWLFLSPIRFRDHADDALASLTYVINLRLANADTDYLSEGTPPSPFQHFWSLAVEEQFYLLWPLLIVVGVRLARRPGLTGRTGRTTSAALAGPVLLVCLLSLVSFAASVLTTEDSASWAYFGSHTRAWELGAGALLALCAARLTRLPAAVAATMTWTGLAAIVIAAVRYDDATPFPGHHALLPVLGAVLVLAGGCAATARLGRLGAGRLLGSGPLIWLGGLSYGWYLWHWPLLMLGPSALDRPASVRLALALSALALLLAWATLHLVENPVRFHAAFRGRPGRALGLGLGLSAGAAALTLTAVVCPPPIPSGEPAPRLGPALAASPDPAARLTELLAEAPALLPSNLAPPLPDIKDGRSAVYRDDCHVGYDVTRPATPCVYGDPTSDTVVVLFGDSHAAQWFPALDRLARANGWKLVSMTKASCKIPAMTTLKNGEPYEACDAWRDNALDAIADLDPALVVAASSEAGRPIHPTPDPDRQVTDGYRDTFERIRATGAEAALLLDTPWPRQDAVECAASAPLELDHCAHGLPQAFRDQHQRGLARAAAQEVGVTVVDPAPWLCAADGSCPVVVGDTAVYRDRSHLSEAYAEAVAPVLEQSLSPLLERGTMDN
ncbi:acyltransferase family protein [Streptomyces sp. B6B3]|uniref:acyltransferase family protein n=1 Tax=Streptomyces sp. B6B3 TaxID=3153570 RepID=UPI00325C82E5